jgi:hypothetical protein
LIKEAKIRCQEALQGVCMQPFALI